jgi:hypothetical protein
MRRNVPLILGVAIVAALAFWAFRRQSASPVADTSAASSATAPQPASPPLAEPSPAAAVKRIDPTRVWELVQKNEVTVIDVRDVDSYLARHVPGSLHIPLSRIEGEVPYLPRDKPIVTYCT